MNKNDRFKSVSFNNRKRQLEVVYTSGKKVILHYSQLGIRSYILEAWVDSETRAHSVGLKYTNGKIDYMPYDQPLAVIRDPDFLLQTHVETLIY